MSFSSGVKEELSRHQTMARHCQIAEIAAIISMCGGVSISEKESYSLKIQTENVYVARKYFTLLKKAFNAFQFCNGIGYFHAFYQTGNTLCISGTSSDKIYMFDDVSVQFELDRL